MSAAVALTTIGLTLTVLSTLFIGLGSLRRRIEVASLFRTQQVTWTTSERNLVTELPIKAVNFAFVVHYKGKCKMKIWPGNGTFRLSFGELPMVPPAEGNRWEIYSPFERRQSSGGSAENYSHDIEPGHYALQFVGQNTDFDAKFDLELQRTVKPLGPLVEPGLTILTVALPILVTGVVSFVFGAGG